MSFRFHLLSFQFLCYDFQNYFFRCKNTAFFTCIKAKNSKKTTDKTKTKKHSRKHSSLGNRQNTEIKRRFIFVKRRFSDCLKKLADLL